MSQKVINLDSPISVPSTGKIPANSPWRIFFQKELQAPVASQDVDVGASPFDFTPNDIGTVHIIGGVITTVELIRGAEVVDVGALRSIMLSIGDTIRITYSGLPTVKFWEL